MKIISSDHSGPSMYFNGILDQQSAKKFAKSLKWECEKEVADFTSGIKDDLNCQFGYDPPSEYILKRYGNINGKPSYSVSGSWDMSQTKDYYIPDDLLVDKKGAELYVKDMIYSGYNQDESVDFLKGILDQIEHKWYRDKKYFIKKDERTHDRKGTLYSVRTSPGDAYLLGFTTWFDSVQEESTPGWNQFFCKNPCDLNTCLLPLDKADSIKMYGEEDWGKLSCNPLASIPPELLRAKNAKFVALWHHDISKIENIPENVEWIELNDNKIMKIENLPPGLKTLEISNNKITKLENLPRGLANLYAWDNQIRNIKLKQIPDSLRYIRLERNPLSNRNWKVFEKLKHREGKSTIIYPKQKPQNV